MSKTREIECWVTKDLQEEFHGILSLRQPGLVFSERSEYFKPCMLKAKIIIEIPEKKIQITESEFDAVYDKSVFNGPNSHGDVFDRMKQKLFGEAKDKG